VRGVCLSGSLELSGDVPAQRLSFCESTPGYSSTRFTACQTTASEALPTVWVNYNK